MLGLTLVFGRNCRREERRRWRDGPKWTRGEHTPLDCVEIGNRISLEPPGGGLVLLAFGPAEAGDLVITRASYVTCGGDHGRSVGSGLKEEELHGKKQL